MHAVIALSNHGRPRQGQLQESRAEWLHRSRMASKRIGGGAEGGVGITNVAGSRPELPYVRRSEHAIRRCSKEAKKLLRSIRADNEHPKMHLAGEQRRQRQA